MIMEARQSHNLLCASLRPRKAVGVVQSESEGLRTRGFDSGNPSLGARTDQTLSQLSRQPRSKRVNFSFLHLKALDDNTHTGEGNLLY